ncbi:MAG: phenylacetate--CoA ligase, partial [Ruminococcaceae bacterium]|nr:phenylacetate--CoA ligase [Oscillospiraceae bacterium]
MEERYYQKEIETMAPEALRALQSEKLVKQVKHVWESCPPYRKKMEEKGVTPDDIK